MSATKIASDWATCRHYCPAWREPGARGHVKYQTQRLPMFHLLFLSGCYLGILVIGLGPALAQTRDVPNATTAETASQIALKNLSGETITQARIRTKQGHEWDMSAGGG